MPLEIERKFLVDPECLWADWPVAYTESAIYQVYLVTRKKKFSSERVRVTIPARGLGPIYTHTTKQRLGAGIHDEDERAIVRSEYRRLLRRADAKMVPISKTRRTFTWREWVFEVDIFEAPFNGLVEMEVELPSMDVQVELPPFITVVREVTTEREFSNAALARKGSWP